MELIPEDQIMAAGSNLVATERNLEVRSQFGCHFLREVFTHYPNLSLVPTLYAYAEPFAPPITTLTPLCCNCLVICLCLPSRL